jgi:hypothetical protein
MTVCGSPRASSGSISFMGEDITQADTHRIMRKGIAISPEGRRVFPDLTVSENLKMGGFFLSRSEIEEGEEHVYKLFPRLKERAAQRAGTMSGGEQQMLAIGRALMSKPFLAATGRTYARPWPPLIIAQIFRHHPHDSGRRCDGVPGGTKTPIRLCKLQTVVMYWKTGESGDAGYRGQFVGQSGYSEGVFWGLDVFAPQKKAEHQKNQRWRICQSLVFFFIYPLLSLK